MSRKKSGKLSRGQVRAALTHAKASHGPDKVAFQDPLVGLEWESFKEAYEASALKCAMYGTIIPLIRIPNIASAVMKRCPDFVNLVQSVKNDSLEMKTRLEKIYDKHSKLTGKIDNEDALFDALQYAEEYTEWARKFDSVVTPRLKDIFAILADSGADVSVSDVKPASDVIES